MMEMMKQNMSDHDPASMAMGIPNATCLCIYTKTLTV